MAKYIRYSANLLEQFSLLLADSNPSLVPVLLQYMDKLIWSARMESASTYPTNEPGQRSYKLQTPLCSLLPNGLAVLMKAT